MEHERTTRGQYVYGRKLAGLISSRMEGTLEASEVTHGSFARRLGTVSEGRSYRDTLVFSKAPFPNCVFLPHEPSQIKKKGGKSSRHGGSLSV
jgi:hypothetical protein